MALHCARLGDEYGAARLGEHGASYQAVRDGAGGEEFERTDQRITSLSGAIEFRNVSFQYRPELPMVIDDVSLRIEPGMTLAIMGRTGSGKTSFVNLIARLYDATGGSICLDGHDIRTIPLEVLRGSIGFVTQEPFLFSETVAENIAFGMATSDKTLMEQAAKDADIYDNVIDFPDQFETMLGERGITLSGGTSNARRSQERSRAIRES